MLKDKILKRPVFSTVLIFVIFLALQAFETLVMRTDRTTVGENIWCRIFGIALIFWLLRELAWSWDSIGFDFDEMGDGLKKGIKISVLCFTFAYLFELMYLAAKGGLPRFKVFAGNFSLTGQSLQQTGIKAILFCALFNIIIVWMEEAAFRGLFINLPQTKHPFLTAALISAALYGIWYLPLPLRSFLDGEWSLGRTLLTGLGCFLLAGLMGLKWAMMRELDGNIWQAFGDHLFNNLVVIGLLHIVTETGTDEMLLPRIAVGQILSFLMILVLYRKKDEPVVERPRRFRRPSLFQNAAPAEPKHKPKQQKKSRR